MHRGAALVHTPCTTVLVSLASMIFILRYFALGICRLICFACGTTRGISASIKARSRIGYSPLLRAISPAMLGTWT